MWSRRAFYLGLSMLSILGGVLADQTITVDGRDQSVKYTTVSNGDDGATWTLVQRSSDSCDTPQTLTSRLGDYMTYTFTGTGIYVIGTTGVKQGIINFTLDGQNITNFNRGRSELMCDQVLFQSLNLPNQQHTVVATLVGRNMNLQTGQPDGVLSVQRVRYTIPGSDGSTPVGPIVGGIIGAVLLIGGCGAAYYFWRKRRPTHRNNAAFWDNDDIGGGKHTANPGIVATPFEWDGPTQPHGAEGNGGAHYGGVERDQTPGSPSFAASQPLLGHSSPPRSASAYNTSFSGPSTSSHNNSSNPNVYYNQLGAPMLGPKTHTSSGSSEERRRSGMTSSTLVASNPDVGRGEKNPAMFAMGPIPGRHDGHAGPAAPGFVSPGAQPARPTSGPVDETQLVDRIAHRLADIMTERVGVGSDAPPSYVGEDGESYAPPPPPPAATQGPSPPPARGSPSYPPQPTISTQPVTSTQYVQSPASASAPGPQLQPPTPPAGSTSFGGPAGRFGPRPRPSGSVGGGRPGEYGAQPPTAQRTMSYSKEQPTPARGASWRADSASPPS